MAWVARGKCKALGRKKSSTPAVVPGAAPALAKAGSADLGIPPFQETPILEYVKPMVTKWQILKP